MRIFWRLFLCYCILVLAVLVLAGAFGFRALGSLYHDAVAEDLQVRARLFAERARPFFHNDPMSGTTSVQALTERLGALTGTRFTVIDGEGRVLADNRSEPERMENHAGRPEVRQAYEGLVGRSMRFSATLRRRLMYVAVPFDFGKKAPVVVRASVAVAGFQEVLEEFRQQIAFGLLIVALLGALASWPLARRLSRPVEAITEATRHYSKEDFDRPLPRTGTLELDTLGEAMRVMADSIRNRIRTIRRQRQELKIIFESMDDGVLAFDREARLLDINRRAAEFFRIAPEAARGRLVHEVIRKADLLRFVEATLEGRSVLTEEMTIQDETPRYFHAIGTPLRDPDSGSAMGGLLVLHDVTPLRTQAIARRQFVANASHELRTPITAIKGFLETLLDGALNEPESACRFTRIALDHADRLAAITDDLMKLTQAENSERTGALNTTAFSMGPWMESLLEEARAAADAKGVTLSLDCPDGLEIKGDEGLLRQAVWNLLDNAVKYGGTGTAVRLRALVEGAQVVIAVEDTGPGIDAPHLPRLFERFYRVDASRSRALGGTGLGLAIVKHIVLAHGGSVSVESSPERGSVFRIHLPAFTATPETSEEETSHSTSP